MGFFDLFIKRKKDDNKIKEIKLNDVSNGQEQDIQIITPVDGGRKIAIEYYNPDIKFGQFYDTTKIIIDKEEQKLGTSNVRECLISWYNEDDTIYSDYNSREDYERILVSLDIDRMVSDEEYCSFAMRKLLNRERIMKYLQIGESSNEPEVPCGNYVGGVREDEEGNLKKVFDIRAGRESHYSPYMMKVRKERRIKNEEARKEKKKRLEEEIKRL